ncbi:DUF2164 family protein [Clostridium sp. C105KSO13]|uniref:DUF2164 family protein n=1 Tax=Clostridium sp. C105KSO13 TaxID=1776045 RepID=UPI000740732F|nr:DUF2164 family protein [Clostridium sp. C105KSO13]CUX42402.1 hypothetical protein BN3456_02239 [Clostridium sp. C105KSO13]
MKRESFKTIKLTDKEKELLREEISAFYLDIRGEQIGIIEKEQLLDLFAENLVPLIYNRALDDARKWYQQQQDNMETDYYMLYKEL